MDENAVDPSKCLHCQSGMTSILTNQLRKYICVSCASDRVASVLENETQAIPQEGPIQAE